MRKVKENRLVVADTSWAADIPEWLMEEIKTERMLLGLAKPDLEEVGDAEACAYLMTASLRAPMPSEHEEIYTWLVARLMSHQGKEVDDFLKEKLAHGLTKYEESELRDLKRTLYSKRGGAIRNPLLDAMRELGKRGKAA